MLPPGDRWLWEEDGRPLDLGLELRKELAPETLTAWILPVDPPAPLQSPLCLEGRDSCLKSQAQAALNKAKCVCGPRFPLASSVPLPPLLTCHPRPGPPGTSASAPGPSLLSGNVPMTSHLLRPEFPRMFPETFTGSRGATQASLSRAWELLWKGRKNPASSLLGLEPD